AARLDDLESLLTMQREAAVAAFSHVFPQDRYPFPSDAIRGVWRATLDDPTIETYLFEIDGDPGGSVLVGSRFLRTLYVLPACQSTGIGSVLHDFALERLRAAGIARAKLWTLKENWRARRFYEGRGWVLTNDTRVGPFPPHPLDVKYERVLELNVP